MPSENLPYLFAVFAVTWIAFFVYMFFVSKHQSDIERQIRELRNTDTPDTVGDTAKD